MLAKHTYKVLRCYWILDIYYLEFTLIFRNKSKIYQKILTITFKNVVNVSINHKSIWIYGSPSSKISHQNVPRTGYISFTSLRYATYFMYSKMEK